MSRRRLTVAMLSRSARVRARVALERVAWGGDVRERLLLRLLGGYYDSVFRRTWIYSGSQPHFFSHRITAFRFGLGYDPPPPAVLSRRFFSAELVRPGDHVLDIGCGDGFFTKRFLSAGAAHVDGIDVDADAIADAQEWNSAPNVTYSLTDAAAEPFPQPPYDAVVWDGSIGHFTEADTRHVLERVRASLTPDGVFVGSESIGREGGDHLQFFESVDDLVALFAPFWGHVQIRELAYPLNADFVRREAYWRCSNDAGRLRAASWLDPRSN